MDLNIDCCSALRWHHEHRRPELGFNLPIDGAVTKAVLLVLANHANDSGECWPAIARIALQSGNKSRAVTQVLRDLEAGEIITTIRSHGRKSSTYKLRLDNTDVSTLHNTQGNRRTKAAHKVTDPAQYAGSTLHNTQGNPAQYAPKPKENHQGEPSEAPSPPIAPPRGQPDQAELRPLLRVLEKQTEPVPPTAPFEAERPSSKPKREPATKRIAPDWKPSTAGLAYAAEWGMPDIDAQVTNFIGNHMARRTRYDWDIAWQNWCRAAKDTAKNAKRAASPSSATRTAAAWSRQ
jgi:hypothetical protein